MTIRLIDAEALKAKWYEINDIDENDRGARFVGYTEIAKLIDQAPTVPADAVQEWIPVSEGLPNAEDCPMNCMVTRRSEYVGNYTDMAVAEADGTWTYEDWKAITIKGEATCISTRDADIIAWMPLPEPYGGEEE